jgi:hypothetical protein
MKKIIIIILILFLSICIYYFINKNTEEIIDLDKIKESVDIENIDYEALPNETIELSSSVLITQEGVYTLTGTLEGSITIDTKGDVKLILDGVNIKSSGPCILVKNANTTNIYLNENTVNYLSDTTEYEDSSYNAVIYSKDDLILDGLGKLVINASYEDGIASTDNLKIINGTYDITSIDESIRGNDSIYILDGNFTLNSKTDAIKTTNIETSGNIVIENGNFNITSSNDGVQSINNLYIQNGEFNITTGNGSSNTSKSSNWGKWGNKNEESSKGLKAANNIVIENGNFSLDTSDDSIHSNNDVNIKGGNYTINSGDDGIHADNELTIDGGNINIEKSYEGIEASIITINNGDISIVSTDDGINVAGGNDSSSYNRPGANNNKNSNNKLTINNGTIKVNASGDGIDINGSGYINGGVIYVEGPIDNSNGFFDYDGTLEVTNATLIGSGSTGMLQTPTTTDLNAILVYLDSSSNANKVITIKQNDDVILTYSSSKNYSAFYIASTALKTNSTYDIYMDSTLIESVTINSSLTKVGSNTSKTQGQGMQGMRR